MALEEPRHIVVCASLGWGHLRALCTLASRLVKYHPGLTVTFFTTRQKFDAVTDEISRDFENNQKDQKDRVRIVALAEDLKNMYNPKVINEKFMEQYQKLLDLQPVWCAKKEVTVAAGDGRVPDVVIVDLFAYDQLVLVRKVHPGVKVFGWSPSPTSGILALMGPFGADTKGLKRRQIEERIAATGESFPEAAFQAAGHGKSDAIIDVPGLPQMYDWEAAPQALPADVFKLGGVFHLAASEVYHEADGIITPTTEAFDPPESITAMRKFLGLTGRKLYMLGPLQPAISGENSVSNELSQSSQGQEIATFLERILKSHGPKSLIYMSFGSTFWIHDSSKIWAFVETMIEKNIPFIMAHASPWAKVPDDVRAKVEASNIGLLTPWAPQQVILNNPVTGWFVSHCGINSIVEAIETEVPIIAWPIGAEQAFNAAHASTNLNIAYELFEVRSGNALKVARTGKTHSGTTEAIRAEAIATLDLAFGEDGKKKRENAKKLREAADRAWTENGSARKQLLEFLNDI